MAACVTTASRILNVSVVFRSVAFLLLMATIFEGRPARAADLETWRHCMQLQDPALSTTACSTIIDAARETPDNLAYAFLYRARAAAYCSHKDQAIRDFHDALKRDATLVHAWYGIGQLAMAAEDFSSAEQAFSKAIEANGEDADVDRYAPDSPGLFRYEPLRARGYARFKKEDIDQAVSDYNAAIKTCPTCAAPYRNRGAAFARQHRLDEAFADFNHAIALNPRAFEGFFIRGYVLSRMRRFQDAIVNYSEALRLRPKAKTILRARADAYSSLGKTKEADEDRKRADTVEAEVKDDRRAACGKGESEADPAEAQEEAEAVAPASDPAALDDAALAALFTGKKWQAKQGLWSVDMEFRRDGTFRQRARDDTQGGNVQVTTDGAWFAAQGKLCLYTNSVLCVSAHKANGNITLARADGTLEYVGPEAKLQSVSLDNSTAPIAEYPLDEKFHPAPAGIAKSPKTMLYNLERLGISPRMRDPPQDYLAAQIRKGEGWDVIDADFPPRLDTQYMARGTASPFAAAVHVARRIKELKAKGYQRIFVGGQFIGGWAALALSTQPKLPLDGIVMLSPLCCSGRVSEETGAPSSDFINNKLYFEQLVARDLYPTVAVFFAGDGWDPGGRGETTSKTLAQRSIASLVIDRPEGFEGENSMWLPVFDYLYRNCITAFLSAPKNAQCAPPDLTNRDFRTIFSSNQLPDVQSRLVDPTTLIGKEFLSFPTPQTFKIASADSTVLKSHEAGERAVASSFRDGKYCITQKVRFQWPVDTDEQCYVIVRWSDTEMLLLDAQGKQVRQWWIGEHD
jgi:tetratricopeptide (TPR) repeat protein